MKAGIHYDIPEDQYQADEGSDAPSLSASAAKILLAQSPLHCWTAHPRLNPKFVREEKEIFDLGTVAHALMLQGIEVGEVCNYPDWKTAAARNERIALRGSGKVPILSKHWDRVQAMVAAGKAQIVAHREASDAFTDGKPEVTLAWFDEEYGVHCRGRLDWLKNDFSVIDDYKSTGKSANPDDLSRSIFGAQWQVQQAFYLRGLKILTGKDAAFRFIVQENEEPYALTVVGLNPAACIFGEKQIFRAMEIWRKCTDSGEWPGYGDRIAWPDIPAYIQAAEEERELR